MHEWESLPEMEWDGRSALLVFDTDEYLLDVQDVRDYLVTSEESLEQVKFQLCASERAPEFEIREFLYDHLGEWIDHLPATEEIDRTINDWIKKHAPTMWTPIAARPSLQSLKAAIEALSKLSLL